jgi:hypothetical protein
LIHVRFAALCGPKSDVPQSQRRAINRRGALAVATTVPDPTADIADAQSDVHEWVDRDLRRRNLGGRFLPPSSTLSRSHPGLHPSTSSGRHKSGSAFNADGNSLTPFVGFPANIGSRLVAPRNEVRPAELQSRCGGQADRRRARECRFAHLAGDCSASRRDSAVAEDFRSELAASEGNEPG